jgi:hypothetical protein
MLNQGESRRCDCGKWFKLVPLQADRWFCDLVGYQTFFELTTLVVIGTDCTGSYKSNYYMIMTTTAPGKVWRKSVSSKTVWMVSQTIDPVINNTEILLKVALNTINH